MKYVIIRYAEIALKGRKRKWFEDILIKNIKEGLKGILEEVKRYPGRIIVKVKEFEKAKNILEKTFGIISFSPTVYYKFKDLNDLLEFSENYFKNIIKDKRFKVEVNRVGKHNFTSYDIKKILGERLSKYGKVDIKNPEVITYLEIRNQDLYLFTEIFKGPGGLPIGSEGKVLSLVSGGFDSTVATWFLMKRGCRVDILHCNIGGEYQEYHVLKVIEKLLEYSIGYNNKIYIAECSNIINKIMEKVNNEYWLVVFKRMIYKLGEKLSKDLGYKAIVTGDSLGQKSSQTLDNLYSSEYKTEIPIFRPLIGFDKHEIISLSRKLGFYEYSEKVPELCAILSESPKTKTTPEEVEREFKKIENELKNIKIRVYNKRNIKERIKELEDIIKKLEYKGEEIDITIGINVDGDVKVKSIKEAIEIAEKLGKDKKYLIICKTGGSAYIVSKILKERGFYVKFSKRKR